MKEEKFKEIIKKEVREALNEISQTGNVAGYQTPFAFSGQSDEAEEDKKEWMKKINKQYGYTMVNEATPEALQDFYAYFKDIPGGPNSVDGKYNPNYVGEKGLDDFREDGLSEADVSKTPGEIARTRVDFSRKPGRWDSVKTYFVRSEIVKNAIDSLKRISYDNENINAYSDARRLDRMQILGELQNVPFVFVRKGEEYLIDPHGYDYPRYAAKLNYSLL